MAYEPNEEGFAYWGNEGTDTDQTQLILALSEQVTDLQAQVEEQSAIINELSESVMYKTGMEKPMGRGIGRTGIGRMTRIPRLTTAGISRFGFRMATREVLSKLGISVPFLGLMISAAFQTYSSVVKDIADKAAKDAIREHERKDEEARRQIMAETLEAVEKERRELYRSVVPP
jgi:hypothetical protein